MGESNRMDFDGLIDGSQRAEADPPIEPNGCQIAGGNFELHPENTRSLESLECLGEQGGAKPPASMWRRNP